MSLTDSHQMFRGSGFWSKRSSWQKKAIIITSLLIVTALVLLCCVLLIKPRSRSTCESLVCQSEARKLLANLKPQADPCHDFFEFACGQYEDTHVLPPDKGRQSTFDSVSDNVLDRLKLLYARPTEDQPVKPLNFISKFYQQCNRSVNDVQSLRQMLAVIGGWPVAGISDSTGHITDWESALLVIVSEFGEQILVSISVSPNPYNTTTYALTLDQPALGLGRAELISNEFGNDTKSSSLVQAYKSFISNAVALISPTTSSQVAAQAADDIVGLETDLAKISTAPEDRRDHREQTKKVSLSQLSQQIGPQIPEFMKKIYLKHETDTLRDDDIVIVSDMDFFRQLESVLSRWNRNGIIQNYMGWRMLQRIGYLASDEFRKSELDFMKEQTGIEKQQDMDRRCLDLLSDTAPDLVGRTYVDHFFTVSDKAIANSMIQQVLLRFKEIIKQKDWMDARTQTNSMAKAAQITVNTGFPDWLMNNTQLQQEYDFGDFEEDSTISTLLKMFRYLTNKAFLKLRKRVDRSKEWPMGAATVNAAYDPTQNSITIPAAILQDVFFNASRPMYLNYGAMGTVIGHEITHGFDDEGAQYDAIGNLENWWTNSTLDHFQQLSQCFVDQYSVITDPRVNISLNGRNTLGENIADNGGIRESFEAYQQLDLSEDLLPGLERYTKQQLFFIAYANTWCSVTRNEKLRQNILYDPHSPAKYRVNLPLANYDAFSNVWGCSCDSSMNKGKERCVVW